MVFQPNYSFKKMQREKAKRARNEGRGEPAGHEVGSPEAGRSAPADEGAFDGGAFDGQALPAAEPAP